MYHDVQKWWQMCYTGAEVYASKRAKTGSAAEQCDSKRVLIFLNIDFQGAQLGESLSRDKSEDIVKFNLSQNLCPSLMGQRVRASFGTLGL